jgi:hypothetical protein
MSVTNVMNPAAIYNGATTPVRQTNQSSLRSEVQQLGSDLQAGNLAAAQQDYVTLSQQGPLANQQTNNPLVQDLQAVGTALQGGDLAGAQQAFATFQQAAQQQAAATPVHHGHHHHGGGQESNPLAQAFNTLAQALQSGNLSTAQTAFATLQQDLQQSGFNFGTNTPGTGAGAAALTTTPASSSVNLTA